MAGPIAAKRPPLFPYDRLRGSARSLQGRSEAKRLAVMRRIVALASETTRIGMGATLLPDHYERLSQNDRELLPDSYGLCVTACIAKTARTLQRARIAEHVDYVFESGDAGQGTTKL